MEQKLKEVEQLGAMAVSGGASSSSKSSSSNFEPLTVYGGTPASGKVVKTKDKAREKMLVQIADLDETIYQSVLRHVAAFSKAFFVLKSGTRGTATKTKNRLTRLVKNVETSLIEYAGNTSGGVNAVLNLKAFEDAMSKDLLPTHLEEARKARSSTLYSAVSDSLKALSESEKAKLSPLKPILPVWQSAVTLTPKTPYTPEAFIEYEQPLAPWEHDDGVNFVDLDTSLVVSPLKKSAPYKFVLVAIDQLATESDIRNAVFAACDQIDIEITGVEVFTDMVANKQRRHAFVSVQTLAQLHHILNDRVRAFGVHINGQRSSILDVEEKNIISIMTRPPMDASRIEATLKDLGIMHLVSKDSSAPTEPIVSSQHLHQHPRSNRFSIFAPRDGNGDLIGKAWLNFPSHSSAYAAFHSLIACRPGSIRAFWSQKSPNHFEEAIRLRDALAAENAELKQKVISLTNTSEDDIATAEDGLSLDHVVSNHIKKVLHTTRGNYTQAAVILNIPERTLQLHVKKFRSNGLDIPMPENRGKGRLTSSRE
jgi:hypothetical protein